MLYTHSRNEALGPLPIIQCVGRNGAHLWRKEESLLRPVLPRPVKASRYKAAAIPVLPGIQVPTFPWATSSLWAADAAFTRALVAAAMDLAASSICSSKFKDSSASCNGDKGFRERCKVRGGRRWGHYAIRRVGQREGAGLTLGLARGFSCSSFFAAASMAAAAPRSSFSAMTVGSSGSTHSVPGGMKGEGRGKPEQGGQWHRATRLASPGPGYLWGLVAEASAEQSNREARLSHDKGLPFLLPLATPHLSWPQQPE